MERKQLEEALIQKSIEDSEFRKQLVSNPKAAVEQFTGQKLPEKLEINVLEETPTTIYISIPTNELSDDELDGASGGSCVHCSPLVLSD